MGLHFFITTFNSSGARRVLSRAAKESGSNTNESILTKPCNLADGSLRASCVAGPAQH